MIARLWSGIWANLLTPSIWTILAVTISHMLHRKAIATHMDKLRDHITRLHRAAPPPAGKPGAGG